MTDTEIEATWARGLAFAEDRATGTVSVNLNEAPRYAQQFLFLIRTQILRAPSARVHSIGAAGALYNMYGGLCPSYHTIDHFTNHVTAPSQQHADPVHGDGDLMAWIGTYAEGRATREAVFWACNTLFHFGFKKGDIPMAWYDERVGKYLKMAPGRYTVKFTGEPQEVEKQQFGGRMSVEFPTDKGIIDTAASDFIDPVAAYARKHRNKITGAKCSFRIEGEGTDRRFFSVKVG